jgi:hypothetical protein
MPSPLARECIETRIEISATPRHASRSAGRRRGTALPTSTLLRALLLGTVGAPARPRLQIEPLLASQRFPTPLFGVSQKASKPRKFGLTLLASVKAPGPQGA